MIPKHIVEKITESNTILDHNYQDGAYYGYSLAMEELKPILDAARELLDHQSVLLLGLRSKQVENLIFNLSQLLKQYDEQH